MLFFPITGANFQGLSRVQTHKSKRFELLFDGLIGFEETFDISLNGPAASARSRSRALSLGSIVIAIVCLDSTRSS